MFYFYVLGFIRFLYILFHGLAICKPSQDHDTYSLLLHKSPGLTLALNVRTLRFFMILL